MIFRAGIVGCGRIGCGFDDDPLRKQVGTHAGAYVRTPEIELVALADLDAAKLDRYAAKFKVPGRYRDYREMLAKERLDILSICTWADTHREVLEAGVAAGVKAVFCEKPIAETLEDADAMIERCAQASVALVIDHKRRFDLCHQQIMQFLKSRGLGRIQQVTCYYTSGLSNTCTHLFDLLRLYLGDIARVQGVMSPNLSPNPGDPNVDGWLWTESGIPIVMQACDVRAYYVFEMVILGTEGRLRVASGTQDAITYERAMPSGHASEYLELMPASSPITEKGNHEVLLAGVRHLVECLKTGQQPVSGGVDGRKALELICALRESAEEGGRLIALPLTESRMRVASR